MSRRVLITGASGLIGRMTLEPLTDLGFEVIATSRSRHIPGADHTIRADLLNEEDRIRAIAEANASHLVHLAWHDEPQGRWSSPMNEQWSKATVELVRKFHEAGGTRAVLAGSCAEYSWANPVLSEDTALEPASPYGRAKADCGRELLEWAERTGFPLVWARIFFVYGPGEPEGRLLGDVIAGILHGRQVACSDGLQKRDYMFTGDVGRGIAHLLEANVTGAINLASGRATPVREIVGKLAELAGTPELINFGARPRPEGDPDALIADVAKLSTTEFQPSYDLNAGLSLCLIDAGIAKR